MPPRTPSTPHHALSRLDNGIRVITVPMRERASATLWFMFGVGSRWESDEDAGIAHFIEHMVFKGGARYRTPRAVSEAIESVGGVLNASTDREATVFYAKVPAARLETALDVLADIMEAPLLDPEEIAKERLVVVEEIRMYQDAPQDHVQTLFDEVMWPDHPLGREVAGTEASVATFDAAACRRELKRHYRCDSLVVCAAGAIDGPAVEAMIGDRLRGWKPAARPGRLTPLPAVDPTGEPFRVVSRRVEQTSVMIGLRAPGYLHEDRYALDTLNCILGEGMSSRLFLEVREQRALAYDVSSFTAKVRDSGALCIALGCDAQRAPDALSAARRELERLASERVGDTEMTKAKEYTRGRLLVQLESTSALGSFYGQQELLMDEVIEPSELLERFDAVSADDVQRVAAGLLDPANGGWRGAAVGPMRSPVKLQRALLNN